MPLPSALRATCPHHGLVTFERIETAEWWVCPVGEYPDHCDSVITSETFVRSPDGGDVESAAEILSRY